MSDQELIKLIKEDQDYLGIIYKNSKEYSMSFMRSMSSQSSTEDLNDIFQNAIIILYEKILDENFILTSTIQTYLNSVCRFQLLNKFRSDKRTTSHDNKLNLDKMDVNMQFDCNINDVLEPIENETEEQFTAIEKALLTLKKGGGKCYELLTLFWYQKKSMEHISDYLGYTNAANAKNQKFKCQKRLEKLAYQYLNY